MTATPTNVYFRPLPKWRNLFHARASSTERTDANQLRTAVNVSTLLMATVWSFREGHCQGRDAKVVCVGSVCRVADKATVERQHWVATLDFLCLVTAITNVPHRTYYVVLFTIIRYNYLTCAQKQTSSQLSLPHGTVN